MKSKRGSASDASDGGCRHQRRRLLLLGTEPFLEEVRQFWRTVEEAWAPDHWEAELANAVWMAVRTGVLSGDEGHQKLDLAARLGIQSVPNRALWQPALTRAIDSGAAVYDTLFVELAV